MISLVSVLFAVFFPREAEMRASLQAGIYAPEKLHELLHRKGLSQSHRIRTRKPIRVDVTSSYFTLGRTSKNPLGISYKEEKSSAKQPTRRKKRNKRFEEYPPPLKKRKAASSDPLCELRFLVRTHLNATCFILKQLAIDVCLAKICKILRHLLRRAGWAA